MRGVEEIFEQRTRIDSQWKECFYYYYHYCITTSLLLLLYTTTTTRIDSQWKECDTAPVRLFTHSDRIDRDHRASHSARSLIRRSATKQGPTTSILPLLLLLTLYYFYYYPIRLLLPHYHKGPVQWHRMYQTDSVWEVSLYSLMITVGM